jgi:aminopeptidase N
VYYKGALFLHTLRSMMGGEAVKTLLRRFVASAEGGPSSCRHVDTEAFLSLAESIAGRSFDGVAETYLYQASLPRIDTTRTQTQLRLKWKSTAGPDFDVPVPVRVGQERRVVPMEGGSGTLAVPPEAEVRIDPENWVMKAN